MLNHGFSVPLIPLQNCWQFKPISRRWWENGDFGGKSGVWPQRVGFRGFGFVLKSDHIIRFHKPTMVGVTKPGKSQTILAHPHHSRKQSKCEKFAAVNGYDRIWREFPELFHLPVD